MDNILNNTELMNLQRIIYPNTYTYVNMHTGICTYIVQKKYTYTHFILLMLFFFHDKEQHRKTVSIGIER